MFKSILTGMATAVLCAGIAAATPLSGEKTYDLLFRDGTLDTIDRQAALLYQRDVTNQLKPDSADRDTGDIALFFRDGEKTVAQLEFRQDGKHRGLGTFPASVGNPMIMYFYEAVIRDMAESAGGSPFYIRNRVKEALVQPSDVTTGEVELNGQMVATQTVKMRPFADDPNRDRMQGFGDLVLTVTMSDAVPGWYLSLTAETAASSEAKPVYRSELTFSGLEAGQ